MKKLLTPLGSISIFFDNVSVDYEAIELSNDPVIFPDLSGRYSITIKYKSNNLKHKIACIIDNLDYINTKIWPESGERLEAQAFYKDDIKLTIGIEADSYYINGERFSDNTYDYDSLYLETGMAYTILDFTNSNDFVFGIAWIVNYNDDNDVQTWYGADPTYM